jgi:hypothetical protein
MNRLIQHSWLTFANGLTTLRVLLVPPILMTGLTAIQLHSSEDYFKIYFGGLPPVLLTAAVCAVGAAGLLLLKKLAGFQLVSGRRTLRGIAVSAGLATILGVEIAVADLFIRYPADTNVPIPQAFLFYPTIGFVAEVIFHLVPLALLVLLLSPFKHRVAIKRIVTAGIVLTAFAEPAFQILFKGDALTWASAYTFGHVFAIAFLQLMVFRVCTRFA